MALDENMVKLWLHQSGFTAAYHLLFHLLHKAITFTNI